MKPLNLLMNHKKTTIYVALSFVIIIGFVLYLKWQETQLQDLKIAYAEKQAQLEIYQTLTQEYLIQIEDQKKAINNLQKERDRAVKEAVKNAYIKGSTISDSNILDAWNDTIRRSRERNAERENNFANN